MSRGPGVKFTSERARAVALEREARRRAAREAAERAERGEPAESVLQTGRITGVSDAPRIGDPGIVVLPDLKPGRGPRPLTPCVTLSRPTIAPPRPAQARTRPSLTPGEQAAAEMAIVEAQLGNREPTEAARRAQDRPSSQQVYLVSGIVVEAGRSKSSDPADLAAAARLRQRDTPAQSEGRCPKCGQGSLGSPERRRQHLIERRWYEGLSESEDKNYAVCRLWANGGVEPCRCGRPIRWVGRDLDRRARCECES